MNSVLDERAIAINEHLLISAVRQHELIEIAERLNEQLAAELEKYRSQRDNVAAEHKKDEGVMDGLRQALALRVGELQEQTIQLRSLAAEIGLTEQRERKRLASLLHDDLQQLLVAAKMQLDTASGRMKDEGARQAVELASRWIGEATKASRHLTRQLRPPVLYQEGLFSALQGLAAEMAERHHLKVVIQGQEAVKPLTDEFKSLLFDSIRELLFNVAKHAEVNEATVMVREEEGNLQVVVVDHGKGFIIKETASNSASFGLFSVRERLTAYGGSVSIVSSPGNGTRVTLKAPLGDITNV